MKQVYNYTHQIGARRAHGKGKKGAREGKKGAAPFYFGLAGTLY